MTTATMSPDSKPDVCVSEKLSGESTRRVSLSSFPYYIWTYVQFTR